jgi:hypothetical protein
MRRQGGKCWRIAGTEPGFDTADPRSLMAAALTAEKGVGLLSVINAPGDNGSIGCNSHQLGGGRQIRSITIRTGRDRG